MEGAYPQNNVVSNYSKKGLKAASNTLRIFSFQLQNKNYWQTENQFGIKGN